MANIALKPNAAGTDYEIITPTEGTQSLAAKLKAFESPAGLWLPGGFPGPWGSVSGSPDTAIINGWPQTRFHDTQDDKIAVVFRLPDDIDLSVNPTMNLYFAMDSLQSGTPTIRFSNGSEYAGDGEIFPAASEGADASVNIPTPANEIFTVVDTLDASLMTLGDLVKYHVERLPSHIDDDASTHNGLFGGLFLYGKATS